MNIDAVKERITALEAAGELTIKERIYLYDKAGMNKLDALSWAVFNKQKAERKTVQK